MSSFQKTKQLTPTSTAWKMQDYVSLKTKQLSQLGWKVLIHPLYSLDITPPDHLFQSLQNSLNGKKLNSLEDHKRHPEQFFIRKIKVLGTWNYEVA